MSRSSTHFQLSVLGRKRNGPSALWVITCYFNPCNYQNRLQNYKRFAHNLRQQSVQLLTIELCARPEAAHLDQTTCTRYVQVVETDVLWAKEQLLNIAERHLPAECTQICWCDCDVLFKDPQWAWATSDLLQRHRVLQPFAKCIFLGPEETPNNYGAFSDSLGFAMYYAQKKQTILGQGDILVGHPGYAWAMRRDIWRQIGGLYDKCILGHADIVMGVAFTHQVARDGPVPTTWEPAWDPGWSVALKDNVRAWQAYVSTVVQGDVGFLPGFIFHLWHGPRDNRQYHVRGQLLADFDPDVHLARGDNGLYHWTPAALALKLDEKCKLYFEKRKEDQQRVK